MNNMKEIESIFNKKLVLLLPEDIIREHILPYSYNIKPKNLLRDIRSYYTEYSILENYYLYDYNYDILLRDLVWFCNSQRDPNSLLVDNYITILSRHFSNRGKSREYLMNVHYILYYSRYIGHSQVKLLFGLMTPKERNQFINKYIISNDPEF